MKRKIIIGITGASGIIYARTLILKALSLEQQIDCVALVFSEQAKSIDEQEPGNNSLNDLLTGQYSVRLQIFDNNNFNAPFASGSSTFDTLFIVPCSMATLAKIAGGLSIDLIARAADVMLKERRKLILGVRETPYQRIHLQNMLSVTDAGGIIAPPVPSFYHHPSTLQEMVDRQVERWLALADFNIENRYLWNDK